MAVKRYRPSSTSTSGTIYRIEKATTTAGYDPEVAVYGQDACAFYGTNFVVLNYPAITGIPTNKISNISIVYRACSTTGGSQSGAIQLLNNSTSITAITLDLTQPGSDTNPYLHDPANYTTYNVPSTLWDLILNGNWSIRVLGRSSNTTLFTIICLDIEYEEPRDLKIGTNRLKSAFLGSTVIQKIYKGAQLLFDSENLLPAEYQEVEYIQSTGSQYFDSGIYGKQGLKTEATLQVNNATSASASLLAARNDTGQTRCYLGYRQYGSSVNFGYQEEQQSGVTPTNTIDTFEYEIKSGELVIKKNGTTILDQQHTTTFTTNYTMYVFGINYTGTASQLISCNLYKLKIWDNDVLVRHYIPCYRKSDDVVGMYDVINDTFKTNLGSGVFTKGPEKRYTLPSDYQQVEYIQSDGSQYIDTGISSTSAIAEWQIKFDPLGSYVHNYEQYLAGDRNAGVQGGKLYYAGGAIKYQGTPLGSGQEMSICDYNIGTVEIGMTKRDGVTCDGTVKSTYPGGVWGSSTFWIFNSHSETNLGATMRLYYLRMYSDAVLVRNFIPCYRKNDNVIGLYDTVSKTFFTNSGSGSFTKGNNVD